MNMRSIEIQALFDKYLEGHCTEEDVHELYTIWHQPEYRLLIDHLLEKAFANPVYAVTGDYDAAAMAAVLRKQVESKKLKPALWYRLRWVAAVLLISVLLTWLYDRRPSSIARVEKPNPEMIGPAKEGAILTLSDGRKILLDTMTAGQIVLGQGVQLDLRQRKIISEEPPGDSRETGYNYLQTPKGRTYNLQLPDGTYVWLNAESSLRFPAAFSHAERKVEVMGEAYFDVAQNAQRPFKVITGQIIIDVLGTQFNVNAYQDEQEIHTTLVNGSVRVSTGKNIDISAPMLHRFPSAVILSPGEEAVVNAAFASNTGRNADTDQRIRKAAADVYKATAWKNGMFYFGRAALKDVLKQFARWYDIEVVYEGRPPDIYIVGEMSRSVTLAGALRALTAAEVHFRLEDNHRLVIVP